MDIHPLLGVFHAAAAGEFPEPDGEVTFLEVHRRGVEAIVALTGHAFVMSALGPEDFAGIDLDGFGMAHRPEAQLRLARGGRIGVTDATLVRTGVPDPVSDIAEIEETDAFLDHPRVRHAMAIRANVRVFAGPDGLVTLASGLAGRQEMSVEAFAPGLGAGRRLIRAAIGVADPGRPLFAAVAPGNARSFRAFQAEGFAVIGSEVVIEPSPRTVERSGLSQSR
jgi:hypothetical protein